MATAITTKRNEMSPRALARMTGVCQLLAAATATLGQIIIPGRLVVSNDAAKTVANIFSHEQLFWWGFVLSIAGILFHLLWSILLYDLLKPVNSRVALLSVIVMVVGSSILALASLLYLGPLVIAQNAPSLSAFTAGQVNGLGFVLLKLESYAIYIFSVFFGCYLLLTAFLVFKSTFLPRILGILVAIAGLGWLVYLSPPVAVHFFRFIAAASAIGEIPLELWLITMAVNEQKWRQRAADALRFSS